MFSDMGHYLAVLTLLTKLTVTASLAATSAVLALNITTFAKKDCDCIVRIVFP